MPSLAVAFNAVRYGEPGASNWSHEEIAAEMRHAVGPISVKVGDWVDEKPQKGMSYHEDHFWGAERDVTFSANGETLRLTERNFYVGGPNSGEWRKRVNTK